MTNRGIGILTIKRSKNEFAIARDTASFGTSKLTRATSLVLLETQSLTRGSE